MIKLEEPFKHEGAAFVGRILDECADNYSRSPEKKAAVGNCKDNVIKCSQEYRSGIPRNIKTVIGQKATNIPSAMRDVYKEKFSRQGTPGRKYYDVILNAGIEEARVCPICELEAPSQLDHYLPKSDFPLLSITPSNLIPVCSLCNGLAAKGNYIPTGYEDSLYHPYFEDEPTVKWLRADIELRDGGAVCITYGVEPLEDSILHERLKIFLKVFNLNSRYGEHAIMDLKSAQSLLKKALDNNPNELNSDLDERRVSAENYSMNSYKSALWRATLRQIDLIIEWLNYKDCL